MKRVTPPVIALLTAAAIAAGLTQAPDSDEVSKRRSCGYHCVPDGNAATPAAPPTEIKVQPVRTNVHSGGREGGAANKRHGGGGRNHPNGSEGVIVEGKVWFTGRTNIHSGGREHNTAQPRHGGQGTPKPTKGVRKV